MPDETLCCICKEPVPPEREEDNRKKSELRYCGGSCSKHKRTNETIEASSERYFKNKKLAELIDKFIYERPISNE